MTTAPDGRVGPAAAALAVAGALEASLAWLALRVGAEGATCPDLGPAFGCSAIVRPRVAALVGPVTVTHLAFLGALATLGAGLLLLLASRDRRGEGEGEGGPLRRLAAASAVGLAVGAGAALGLQPLGWLGGGVVCPLCLALALLALGAWLAGFVAAGRAGVARRTAVVAFALTLLIVAPGATLRGRAVAADDVARLADAEAFLRRPRAGPGPRVLLVLREDCPYCRALLVDVVADPRVQAALAPAGAIDVVGPDDARARALRVAGPPTLAVLTASGAPSGGLLEGYQASAEAYARAVEARLTGAR